jgi:HNH endonuclease
MKRCAKCRHTKPLAEFNRNASTRDGRQWYCRPCDRAAVSAYARVFRPKRADIRKRKMKLCKVHPECATIDRHEVLHRGGGLCGICGKKVRPKWHMDHIIPISKGGIHCYLNLQPSHIRCNLRKGNRVGTP